MFRYIVLVTLFTLKFLFYLNTGFCQYPERINITTDREVYFAGENIWYKLICLKPGSDQPSLLSKVCYMELLNMKNSPVLQYKIYLTTSHNNSKISLPDTLSTGNYILRSYTNWMKNFGDGIFSSKVISVINPFQNNVFERLEKIGTEVSEENIENEQSGETQLRPGKNEYRTRSLAEVGIMNAGGLSSISVSVSKLPLISRPVRISENSRSLENSGENKNSFRSNQLTVFLPEIEGEIISGTIRNKSDNKPLTGEVLTLGIVGRVPLLYLSRSDSDGRFRFVTNQFGGKEVVIQPLSADTSNKEILIELDPAFIKSNKNLQLKSAPLDDKLIEELNRCIINMQVEAIYKPVAKRNQLPASTPVNYSFYGEPVSKALLDKFIELPTMFEVFKELIPTVTIAERGQVKTFRVYGNSTVIRNNFAVVDGILIKDVNRIAEMNPDDIMQIEVINSPYFFQDQELGAIISIQTRKGDLSALNFDNRIFRQEFQGYELTYNWNGPDYSVDSIRSSPIADFRNVLYWNPDLQIDKSGSGTIKFFTSDDTGSYMIVVEGIDATGKKRRIEAPLSVVN